MSDLLRVRVQPRAPRSEIVGWRADGALGVRVAAPPVEGQANAALAALLAHVLDVRRAAVSIEHGARGRDKLVRIAGLTPDQIRRRLGGSPGAQEVQHEDGGGAGSAPDLGGRRGGRPRRPA